MFSNQPSSAGEAAAAETGQGGAKHEGPGQDAAPKRTEPSAAPTLRQVLYLVVVEGLGSMVISGGINFALAYAMYAHQTGPIRLFQFPNTLAGDAAVTIFVQSVITWLIEAILVPRDIAQGLVEPIGWAGRAPTNRLLRFLFFLPSDATKAPAARVRVFRPVALAHHLVRGILVGAIAFVTLWPPTIGLLTLVGERDGWDWKFGARWAPQIFKLVLAGVLALLTTPLMAAFWLVRAVWAAGP